MLDNYYIAISKVLESKNNKAIRTRSISKISSKLNKNSDDNFKKRYNNSKKLVDNNEDIIVDDSLNNALQENYKMKAMLEERFAENPMLKDIFDKKRDENKMEELAE